MSELTLVIPCYNEEKRLDREAFAAARASFPELSLLFVDDGSRDGTAAMLRQMVAGDSARMAMFSLERNSGKAEAVRRGMLAALERGDTLVGYWDADLATAFNQLPLFLDAARDFPETEGFLGSRVRMLGRQIERNLTRHYLGRIVATLVGGITGMGTYDSQCGAKLFRASPLLRKALAEPFCSRWLFDVELLMRLWEASGRPHAADLLRELPLGAWRDVAGSKVSLKDTLPVLRDLWRIWRRSRRSRGGSTITP